MKKSHEHGKEVEDPLSTLLLVSGKQINIVCGGLEGGSGRLRVKGTLSLPPMQLALPLFMDGPSLSNSVIRQLYTEMQIVSAILNRS